MNALRSALSLLIAATCAWGNVRVPKATLAGETVYVRLGRDSADVTAVFAFEYYWYTKDAKIVYFPLFAPDGVAPIKVLERAKIEFEVADQKVVVASPCPAPPGMMDTWQGSRIHWFAVNLEYAVESDKLDNKTDNILICFSYSQPLIGGRFYYLPIIPRESPRSDGSWAYQMLVRSAAKPVVVVSEKTDYIRLADTIVVYLKHGEVVEIQ